MASPTLGYWNVRGIAQPIRLLLAYTETDFIDKRYNNGSTPEEKIEWLQAKNTLGLDFPNLPYYIDGDVKITQSVCIIRYLAEKHHLAGNTEREKIRIDMLESQLQDDRSAFMRTTFDSHFETAKVDYLKTLPNTLKKLSSFLGKNAFFAGNNITFVDFMAYEFIDLHYYIAPDIFVNYDNLKEFLERIEALPTIAKYQASEDYIRWPSGSVVTWYKSKFYSQFNKYIKGT